MGTIPDGLARRLTGRSAMIGAARDSLANPTWEAATRRILIVRLSPFADVGKSTAHLILFASCRAALPEAYIDFAFLPPRGDRDLLDTSGLPWFYGLASLASPADFDLVMVSNAFGLELVNLPWLLSTSGLPLASGERVALPDCPIFILGGSNASSAGVLLIGDGVAPGRQGEAGSDAIVDGIFFGEGEIAAGELARILTCREIARAGRLAAAMAVEGFWAARSGVPARRSIIRPMPPVLPRYPVLNGEEASTARLQITAGCPGYCSFCLEGWECSPYREADIEALIPAARQLRAQSGADTLEIYSFNFNTHASVFNLIFELNRLFRRVNFMSQRLDILAGEPGLLRSELAADKRSFTLGIEGISTKMRAYYRKGLSDEALESLMEKLIAPGKREVKLFFIIAGIEGEADFAEFAEFLEGIGSRRAAAAPGLRVLVSAGYLVRLPFTPLQFAPLALDETVLRKIVGHMKSACDRNGIEFRLAAHFDEYCVDQLLALSGSRLSSWLRSAPSERLVYDGSLPRAVWSSLSAFARSQGLIRDIGAEASAPTSFEAEKPRDYLPPFSFIEDHTRLETLWRHYVESRRRKDRSSCLGEGCSDCGACIEPMDRAALAGHKSRGMPSTDFPERLGRLMARKAAFASLKVLARIPPSLAGALPQYRSSWLLRHLASAVPDSAAIVFSAEECLFSRGKLGELLPGFTGACAFELIGPDPGKLEMVARAAGLIPFVAMPDPDRITVKVKIEVPFASEALGAFRAWLAAERVAYMEGKLATGGRSIALSARDRKKHVLHEALLSQEDDRGFEATLILGAKARLKDWLDRISPQAARLASIEVISFEPCLVDTGIAASVEADG